jgi:hypothetical protein
MHGVMVLQKFRILAQDGALCWIFNVLFQLRHPRFAGVHEQLVQHLECFQICSFGVRTTLQHSDQPRKDPLNDRQRIGNQECPECRASNDDQFGGLHEDLHVPALHQIPADNGSDYRKNSYDCKHV